MDRLDGDRALERAALALGRLDQALSGHPLRTAWLHRARLGAAQRGAAEDGRAVDPGRLLALVLELPADRRRDYGAEAHALRLFRALQRQDDEMGEGETGGAGAADAAPALDDLLEILDREAGRHPVLSAAGHALWQWRRSGRPPGIGQVAVPLFLARTGLAGAPLPGLCLAPPPAEPLDLWLGRWLNGLAARADQARRGLDGLALTWTLWRRRIGERRSSSRLVRLAGLAAAMPRLSPALAERHLGCTRRGACLLLAELARLGVLREVTGRRAWKLYVTEDLGTPDLGAAPPPGPDIPAGDAATVPDTPARDMAALRHRPPPRRLPEAAEPVPPPEIDLSALLRDTDRAIARVTALLAPPCAGRRADPAETSTGNTAAQQEV